MTLLSRLAHKSGAPVLLVFAERLPAGRGFHLHIQRIEPTIAGADMVRSLTTLNQAIEQAVRGIPAQYQWSYKRFKTPSDGERAPY